MRCSYVVDFDNTTYHCYSFYAHVTSETLPITFQGDHLEGFNDSNVTKFHISIDRFGSFEYLTSAVIERFQNLKYFYVFSPTLVKVAPDAFGDCETLEEIEFQANNISSFDNVFRNCKNVKTLMLTMREVEDYDKKVFEGLENLEKLTLQGENKFNLTDDSFTELKKLREVDITSITLTNFTEKFLETLTDLEKFKCMNCRTERLHENSFKNNEKLKDLNFGINNIEGLPDGLLKAQNNLERLNFNLNGIPKISSDVFGFHVNLTVMIFSFNIIDKIDPEIFGKVPNLEELYISRNRCVNLDFESVKSIDLATDERLKKCFDNWTSSGDRKNIELSLILISFIVILVNFNL